MTSALIERRYSTRNPVITQTRKPWVHEFALSPCPLPRSGGGGGTKEVGALLAQGSRPGLMSYAPSGLGVKCAPLTQAVGPGWARLPLRGSGIFAGWRRRLDGDWSFDFRAPKGRPITAQADGLGQEAKPIPDGKP